MFESFNVWAYLPPVLPAVNVILKRLTICMTFTATSKGGEYRHLLTSSEMPKHSHTLARLPATSPIGGGTDTNAYIPYNGGAGLMYTNEVGGNTAHNNLPPYEGVYYWHRTS